MTKEVIGIGYKWSNMKGSFGLIVLMRDTTDNQVVHTKP